MGPDQANPDFLSEPPGTVAEYFISELRRHRHRAGLSQSQLARRISYSAGLVSMVETGQRAAGRDFTERCDEVLDTGGALLRMWPLLAQDVHPRWFQPFVGLEAEAEALHEFEVLAVPGLLQTEAYARANLAVGWPPKPRHELEQTLVARLARQRIMGRDEPPMLWFIIDESVLLRPFGDSAVMAEQLWHLVSLLREPYARLAILPMGKSGRAAVDGAFTVLEMPDNDHLAYVEGPASGRLIVDPSDVRRCERTFDAIRAQALSVEDSAALIVRTIGERYEHPSGSALVDQLP